VHGGRSVYVTTVMMRDLRFHEISSAARLFQTFHTHGDRLSIRGVACDANMFFVLLSESAIAAVLRFVRLCGLLTA